ncbi:MAG: NADH-quinone oxidoreductase subunit NuoG [Gammaproteobacteria bacterium]
MSAKPEDVVRAADTVTIEVNGKPITAKKGEMIIQATDAAGIYIPRFCYHGKLPIAANCRMCLIEVEKSPKPLPACATPVADGMKVYTHSAKARDAQKGVMEFLLINHPLDCPICDQGGECPLQDQALGYGKDVSRFTEGKRVVPDEDIGPLIATYMTRCIHCTRCVRFGQELAGVMEFGMLGRGEHAEIRTFLDRSVDSELSGNVIDICPVGALTSKPFRFKARAWELAHHASISPHDCVGANLDVHTLRGKVMRVLPRTNEAVNECWLADRDRFSYEGLNVDARLKQPMVKRNGQWQEVDWPTALDAVVDGLRKVIDAHGADSLGALAAPTSTVEELYLLQKFVRALGSNNVDHRLRQLDFSDDAAMPTYPALGLPIAELERLDTVLLIGANPRKDQPLIGLRLRKAHKAGARVMAINPVDYAFTYPLHEKIIGAPIDMLAAAAEVAKAAGAAKAHVAGWIDTVTPRSAAQAIAQTLASGKRMAVLLGAYAMAHPQSAVLRALAAQIAARTGATLGFLPEANGAGAWLAGCVPHRAPAGQSLASRGRDTAAMLREPRNAYLIFGAEPELDVLDSGPARRAMEAAEFVAMITSFKPSPYESSAVEYADVLLPLAAFTESDGSFINAEGRLQSFAPAVAPPGEARPGWKILRVLGNRLELAGFEQTTIDDVRAELALDRTAPGSYAVDRAIPTPTPVTGALVRITEVPIYAADALVRHAPSLQQTADNPRPAARLNATEIARHGLAAGVAVKVRSANGDARLEVVVDPRVPDGCVLIAAGYPATAGLDAAGAVTLERAP